MNNCDRQDILGYKKCGVNNPKHLSAATPLDTYYQSKPPNTSILNSITNWVHGNQR
ncbi:hypothetical protein H6G33_20835 [Calothrix sp. FACHB-1219]|uniref:hypothetical protein n=1 Tax=unclassified Calothrix TaxID=2619626 RepID=UPI001687BC98|nr:MULTISPECIES: hypothetical protein [unclassified Calothrix]MBD2206369.1 hypothetical protein [Calothrix sp. FACHB-168]MBD2219464.1 hypothetical protein [Calothrix sp. FACHB-1219]